MRTEIKLESGCQEPWAEIHTAQLTDEVREAVEKLSSGGGAPAREKAGGMEGPVVGEGTLAGEKDGRIFLLRPEEVELIRVERERTVAHTRDGAAYEIRRRLYTLEEALGAGFLRISKGTLVNFRSIRCVEPTVGGLMLLITRGGQRDYISRNYLPAFKAALGLGGKKR